VNVANLVLERARSEPASPAIHYPTGRDSNGRVRYACATNKELDRESDDIANGLASVGIGRGLRTAVMVRPSRELFALTLALFKLGAVPVMVDPGIGLRRLGRCLNEAEPEAFIGVPAAQAARQLLGWGRKTLRISVTVGRPALFADATLRELAARGRTIEPLSVAETAPDDLAAVLFTSGSTGPPKGVLYRHRNMAAQIEAIRGLANIEPGEIDLPTFPLFALFDPALGMSAVVPDMDPTRPGEVEPTRIIDAAEEFGATNLFGSPALLETVGRYGEAKGVKLTTLRRVVSAGAPVPPETMARFLRMLPDDAEVFTPYGATECLPVSCISSREVLHETAARSDAGDGTCVGMPVPSVEVRILQIDDGPIDRWRSDLELPQGEIGEITVRGPQATTGYYNRPEAELLAKIRDPHSEERWHRMGDVGFIDEQGRIWYCGRKADRVVTEAGTLYTARVEGVYDVHRQVRRTALVGVPYDSTSTGARQEPVLCVELLAGVGRGKRAEVVRELEALGAKNPETRNIETFLFKKRFPVDIRHNAKINRAALARWATRRLRRKVATNGLVEE
jgi:acyl-CoA synthetase (AMP-forming)/AMP-acid ligase II